MDNTIDYEAIKKLAESIREFAKKLGEILSEVAEKLGKIIGKTKFKPVKSLIKPYKQPFIKVRYRARANL